MSLVPLFILFSPNIEVHTQDVERAILLGMLISSAEKKKPINSRLQGER